MLSDIAGILSSPLVHSPVIFLIFRGVYFLSNNVRVISYISWLPLVWLLVCSLTYPSVLLIKHLEEQYPVIPVESKRWHNTDAIVVLACNYFEDEGLPFVSRWPNCSLQRNLHAALMYQKLEKPIYLAGGVLGKDDEYSQAEHNSDFFQNIGIDTNHIFTTPLGHNTETETAALTQILRGKHISLVTSASHMPRAVKYFERHNIKVLAIPVEHLSRSQVTPVIGLPNAHSLYRSERAIHEYLGLVYQRYFL